MPLDAVLTLVVLLVVTACMAREWVGADVAMFSGVCVLVVAGVLEPFEALDGFSNPAVITIGVLFVVTSAVQETGGLLLLSRAIFGNTRSPTRALLRLVVPTAAMSSVLNNTPVVAMLIPPVRDFAQRIGESPSRFLMPLSYAAILGGTCTTIGTSSNLVVSGALSARGAEKDDGRRTREDAGQDPGNRPGGPGHLRRGSMRGRSTCTRTLKRERHF